MLPVSLQCLTYSVFCGCGMFVFPHSVLAYRSKINAVFELIDNETKQLRATKKDTPFDVSVSVAGGGIEPPTSGL